MKEGTMDLTSKSKFLSLVLRHRPEVIGLKLDPAGWVGVDDLLDAMERNHKGIDRTTLDEIVATDSKKRYEYSPDRSSVRACQGHSVKDVDLQLEPKEPPATLYHGTASRFMNSILMEGIKPGNRLYVHLSWGAETAVKVGQRHGSPAVLEVDAGRMHRDGHEFLLSNNNVWLAKFVSPQYISWSGR